MGGVGAKHPPYGCDVRRRVMGGVGAEHPPYGCT